MMNLILFGDNRETMRAWARDGVKVQMCVTSPPYYGLRDYGHDGQIGLEETPEQYIASLVEVFRCVRDILADDGTLWLNIGDSYARNPSKGGSGPGGKNEAYSDTYTRANERRTDGAGVGQRSAQLKLRNGADGIKEKDLIGIPWMLAYALRAGFSKCSCCGTEKRADLWPIHNGHRICIDCILVGNTESKIIQSVPGWYLRQEIIWHKPNPMPESVTDRCTKSHEHFFLLAKSERYFYDHEAVKEPAVRAGDMPGGKGHYIQHSAGGHNKDGLTELGKKEVAESRNKRSVWSIATKPYEGAHFAVYPPELIIPAIQAGTSERGHCPQCGSRWSRVTEQETELIGNSAKAGRTAEEINSTGKHLGGVNGGNKNLKSGPIVRSHTTGWEPGCECGVPSIPDIVLDPFMGSGTTAATAASLGRQYAGCELNIDYRTLQEKRIYEATCQGDMFRDALFG